MSPNEHQLLVQLQARILAQQMFMRTVLTAAFMNTPDPLAAVDEMRCDQRNVRSVALRTTGEYEDKVWDAAAESFESELDQVVTRIQDQLAALATSNSRDGPDKSPSPEVNAWRERVLYET